ncbi:MAG: retroviral-like aspartic protease family protein [Lentimicrobiaceae bacterium]|jgi:hypothetical protein|nr:retroviral-like aspartic protease family protein [Lentimicrobiaceae bacterium]
MRKPKTAIPIKILSIEEDGFHFMVKGFLNGIGASFLIDTGASRTVLDKTALRKFTDNQNIIEREGRAAGLGSNELESAETRIEMLVLGDFILKNYQIAVMDLQNIHEVYAMLNLPAIDCVLGSDILVAQNAVIHLKRKKLVLELHSSE